MYIRYKSKERRKKIRKSKNNLKDRSQYYLHQRETIGNVIHLGIAGMQVELISRGQHSHDSSLNQIESCSLHYDTPASAEINTCTIIQLDKLFILHSLCCTGHSTELHFLSTLSYASALLAIPCSPAFGQGGIFHSARKRLVRIGQI